MATGHEHGFDLEVKQTDHQAEVVFACSSRCDREGWTGCEGLANVKSANRERVDQSWLFVSSSCCLQELYLLYVLNWRSGMPAKRGLMVLKLLAGSNTVPSDKEVASLAIWHPARPLRRMATMAGRLCST